MTDSQDFVDGEEIHHQAAMSIGVLSHLRELLVQLELPKDQVAHFTKDGDEGLNITTTDVRVLSQEITWDSVFQALEDGAKALAEQDCDDIDESEA